MCKRRQLVKRRLEWIEGRVEFRNATLHTKVSQGRVKVDRDLDVEIEIGIFLIEKGLF